MQLCSEQTLSILTVSTCWPVWFTELIIWQASQGVVLLRVIRYESVVVDASTAFVQNCLIMGWGVIWIPGQWQFTLSRRTWRIKTMGPWNKLFILKFLRVALFLTFTFVGKLWQWPCFVSLTAYRGVFYEFWRIQKTFTKSFAFVAAKRY